jgi:hypothetical protein
MIGPSVEIATHPRHGGHHRVLIVAHDTARSGESIES